MMDFSEFAQRMGSVLMEGSSTSAFVRTLFEAILPEDYYNTLEKSQNSFKSYYNGKRCITALAVKINAHTQTKLFEKFIKKSRETSIRKLCSAFSDALPDIDSSNAGKTLAELFDKIITESANAKRRIKRSHVVSAEVTEKPEKALMEVETVENSGNQSQYMQNQGSENDGFDDDDARKQFFEHFEQFCGKGNEIMIGKNVNKIGYVHSINMN